MHARSLSIALPVVCLMLACKGQYLRIMEGSVVPMTLGKVSSCKEAKASGVYELQEKLPVFCLAGVEGGGWTRVARLNAPWVGYCQKSDSPENTQYNLEVDPQLPAGKLSDKAVNRYVLNGTTSYTVLLIVKGTMGRGHEISANVNGAYSTQNSQHATTWKCADGWIERLAVPFSRNSMQDCGCGPFGPCFGCTQEDENKMHVVLGCADPSHPVTMAYGLHVGGGFCNLDNRGSYPVDVYVQ